MSFMSQQNQLQHPRYEDLAFKMLRGTASSSTKIVLRQINAPEFSTEISNEVGTTDQAVGDVTAEMMITTLGKIPNEMYYLEDTAPNIQTTVARAMGKAMHTTVSANSTTTNGYTSRSIVFLILTITFLVLLFLCCITACMISRTRRKNHFFDRNDIDCDPECSGLSRPLLRTEKISDTTSKTSSSYLKK